MKMNVFIDTNILLNFYKLSDILLDKFFSLVHLLEEGKIELLVTDQLMDEFDRNREKVIKKTLDLFEETLQGLRVPTPANDYNDMQEIKKLITQLNSLNIDLLEKIDKDADNKNLKADRIVYALFKSPVKANEFVNDCAFRRVMKGNPPGKKITYGDALNWEILLSEAPEGEDLYFISNDNDYKSSLSSGKMDMFLKEEWEKRKHSRIHLYDSLARFLKENFQKLSRITGYDIIEEIKSLGNHFEYPAYKEQEEAPIYTET